MEIKLTSKDTIQLAKAIHGGRLAIDKVEALRKLVKDYRPHEPMKQEEFTSILRFLTSHGFTPTPKFNWADFATGEAADVLSEYDYADNTGAYRLYEELLRSAHRGILALGALGGKFDIK